MAGRMESFFLLYAAWVRSRAERPSVSYSKVVSKVARTGHNLHLQKQIKQQTLFTASGSYYFAAASMSQGHVHPEKALVVEPEDYPLPPHLIRWPAKSPGRASTLPLATENERFPIPQYLADKARELYQKGPVFLTTEQCLLDDDLNPKDWLPAFCAHSIPGFSSENILSVTTPEVLRDFGSRVASPFLEKEPMKAFEYLFFFFFLVSRTRHHSCAGHCSTIRSHCNFIRNATIPPGRNTHQKNTKPTATKQKTNNATPTTPKPKTKHLSGNRVAYFCTTYN